MPREKAGFRDTIEDVHRQGYGDLLSYQDVMKLTKLSRNTVKKHFKFNSMGKLAVADYARQICI